jgi:hypothetical protein
MRRAQISMEFIRIVQGVARITEVGWKERALLRTVSKIPETVRHERQGRVAGQSELRRASRGVTQHEIGA